MSSPTGDDAPRFSSYPHTGRLEDVVRQVDKHLNRPPSCPSSPDPAPPFALTTLTFRGTVKLHGTHGDIVATTSANEITALHCQSRNRIVAVGDDNLGFAAFVAARDAAFRAIVLSVLRDSPSTALSASSLVHVGAAGDDTEAEAAAAGTVLLAGEYCGGNLQDDTGLQAFPRMFVLCGVKVGGSWRDMAALPTLPSAPADGILNILSFPTFSLTIDFSDPSSVAAAKEEVRRLTLAVEESCPFCTHLLGSGEAGGKGEGLVWVPLERRLATNHRYWFKTKGDQYRTLRRTPLTADEKAAARLKKAGESFALSAEDINFVERCTLSRCGQGVEYVREMVLTPADAGVLAAQHLRPFLAWLGGDVWREEAEHTLGPLGLREGVGRKLVGQVATRWWAEHVSPSAAALLTAGAVGL